jgi:hypothetical protein
MPKPVRLTSAEHREWSHNVPLLVNKNGIPQTSVDPAIEEASEKMRGLAVRQGKSLKQKVPITKRDDKGNIVTSKQVSIEVRVQRTGPNSDDVQSFVYVEGMLKVPTREVMKARLFKAHGECQLMRPNGKFLKIIRDPAKVSSAATVSGPLAGHVHVPSPENCACKAWGEPHPGKHSPVCQFNMMAPEAERGMHPGELSPGVVNRQTREQVRAAKEAAVSVALKVVPSPSECVCLHWEGDHQEKGQHSPVCEHFDAWEKKNIPKPGEPAPEGDYFLVDLDSGEVARAATAVEVRSSLKEAERTGSRIIKIGSTIYAVLLESEIPKADEDIVEEDDGEEGDTEDFDTSDSEAYFNHGGEPADASEDAASDVNAPQTIRGAALDTSLDEGGLQLPGLAPPVD